MRFVLTILALLPAVARADEPPLAIRNAAVETLAAAGRVEGATVLFRDGKIAAVGKDVKASPNAKVIDATGMYVTPGIIDAHSHSALDSIN